MQIEGLTKAQVKLADQLWSLDTLDEVNQFINQLPKSQQHQARVVLEMIELAAIDDMVRDDDLDLAKELIESVR